MKSRSSQTLPVRCLCLAILLGSGGCRSTDDPRRGTIPPKALVEKVLDKAQDPRKYWIKVYRGEHGPIFENSHRLHANQHAEVEFETNKQSLAPMIPGMTRKKESHPALIDTLSEHNWIDFYHALQFGAIALGPEPYGLRPTHVLDSTTSFVGLLPTFRIGMMQMESLVVNIRPVNMDLGPLERGVKDPYPVFVLGQDFLKPFSFIRIDFPIRTIAFSVSQPYKPDPVKLLAACTFEYGNRGLTVQGTLDNYEGAIAIDLAGDYEFAIPYPEASVETQLTLGSFVRRQVPVRNSLDLGFSARSLPSIGNLMFRDLVVTIDNRTKTLYLEKPPSR
jgi:hypothetical protein